MCLENANCTFFIVLLFFHFFIAYVVQCFLILDAHVIGRIFIDGLGASRSLSLLFLDFNLMRFFASLFFLHNFLQVEHFSVKPIFIHLSIWFCCFVFELFNDASEDTLFDLFIQSFDLAEGELIIGALESLPNAFQFESYLELLPQLALYSRYFLVAAPGYLVVCELSVFLHVLQITTSLTTRLHLLHPLHKMHALLCNIARKNLLHHLVGTFSAGRSNCMECSRSLLPERMQLRELLRYSLSGRMSTGRKESYPGIIFGAITGRPREDCSFYRTYFIYYMLMLKISPTCLEHQLTAAITISLCFYT